MKALQKCVVSAVLGSIGLVISLVLFATTADDVQLAKFMNEQPANTSYEVLSVCRTIKGNHHVYVGDGHRGSKFAAAADAVYTPVFPSETEDLGQSVRLIAKLGGETDVDRFAAEVAADNVHGVVWNGDRVPLEAQNELRKYYPFIAYANCKVIDLTHPVPAANYRSRRIAAFGLIALALVSFAYAIFSGWNAWQYVENTYALLDKSTLPEHAQKFFTAQSERLEKLGFKRVCDLAVSSKTRSNVRTFVSSDLKTVAIIESSFAHDCYKMGSITVDGTYLRTCSKEELAVKNTPVVAFKAPSDDAALGYAAHHKGCTSLEKKLGVERLTFDPRNVLGFLDFDNRVTGWAKFEQGAGGRPDPLPTPQEIQKERGEMKIYKWAASNWSEDLEAAAV